MSGDGEMGQGTRTVLFLFFFLKILSEKKAHFQLTAQTLGAEGVTSTDVLSLLDQNKKSIAEEKDSIKKRTRRRGGEKMIVVEFEMREMKRKKLMQSKKVEELKRYIERSRGSRIFGAVEHRMT